MTPAILSEATLPSAIRQAMEESEGRLHRHQIMRWLHQHHSDRWEDKQIRTHLRSCSVNNPAAIARHPNLPRFLHDCGSGVYELYDEQRHGAFDPRGFIEGELQDSSEEELVELVDEQTAQGKFAYEAHLRDYLAENLNLLEAGLKLWTGTRDGSVEYSVGGRRIDILARDRQGIPVIVELKLSRGHERTLGQALYYRGKLKLLLSLPRVRIIMVAADITDELRIASTEVTDVDLFSYALTMQVQKLDIQSLVI